MAREYAKLKSCIWSDPEWTRCTDNAQRIYCLAFSQPDITYAGVVPYRPRRWASMAKNTTVAAVRRAIAELEAAGFVIIDPSTEELLIRTFVRHDGVLAVPNMARSMVKAYRGILSEHLRSVVLRELARDYAASDDESREKGWAVVMQPQRAGGMAEDLEPLLQEIGGP